MTNLEVSPSDGDLSQGALHESEMEMTSQDVNQNTNGDSSSSATITLRMIMQGKVSFYTTYTTYNM